MDYIIIGEIINSHGIQGAIKVRPLTADIDRFSSLEKVYLGQERLELNIEFVKYHKDSIIIKFKEFDNINDILSFKNNYIYIDIEERINLPADSFFIHELIDCKVYDISGSFIGVVEDISQDASNDVYIIRNYKTNKDYMIPAVRNFVKSIDVKDKKIIIDPIEGMIE